MSANNGSQNTELLQKEAKHRYKNEHMSAKGVLDASLLEPCCPRCVHKDCQTCAAKEDQIASRFWDYACLNACRVISGKYPIEDFL